MIIGIIGAGLIGTKRARAVHNLGKIGYIADIDKERGLHLSKQLNADYVSDYKKIINEKKVDIVIISLYNNLLTPIAIEAIKNHKHVLIEKPVSISKKQFLDLLNTYKKGNVKLKVGFNHRYHPAFLKIKEIERNNKHRMGDVIFIRANYGHGGRLNYEKEWRFNKEISGGGELIDQGVHLIDLALRFIPELYLSRAHLRTYYWNTALEDNCFLMLKNKKGNMAQLHASCTQWKNEFRFDIFYKNALISVHGLGGSYGTEKLIYYQMKPDMGKPLAEEFIFEGEDNSWGLELEELINAIKENREPYGNIHDAKAALDIVFDAYERAKKE